MRTVKRGEITVEDKSCCQKNAHHSEEFKRRLRGRLNRIEGQVKAIQRMIAEDVYCDDVLNQISSAKSALNGVGRSLLEAHMKSCVVEQIKEGRDEVVDELLYTINKLLK